MVIIIIIRVFWAQDAVILFAYIIALQMKLFSVVLFYWLISPQLVQCPALIQKFGHLRRCHFLR